MNRFYPIYHGLVAAAPWGVASERRGPDGATSAAVLLLCRTEREAVECVELTRLGQAMKDFRAAQVAARAKRGRGRGAALTG